MRLHEITRRNILQDASGELKRDIHRALKSSFPPVERDHLVQAMYGLPDDSEKESLEAERIRAETEVKRADAAKVRSAIFAPANMASGMYFLIYQDARLEWRWTLLAGNGEKIAVSSEGYSDNAACRNSIDLFKAAWAAPAYRR